MALSGKRLEKDWARLVKRLGSRPALEASAKRCGALSRRREIRTAEVLLRLALAYGPCGMSLRVAAAWASIKGIGKISAVGLMKRLRGCAKWLEELVGQLLSRRLRQQRCGSGRVIRLYDATTVSHPGSDRANWRLHATYDPRAGQLSDVQLTSIKNGESLTRARVSAGEIWLGDRGLAYGPGLVHVVRHGADFIVRLGWKSLKLRDKDGQPFDLAGRLAALEKTPSRQFRAWISVGHGETLPVRLLVRRKTPEQEAREIKRVREKAAHRGRARRGGQPDPRSLLAARYIVLATSLQARPREVFALYRLRWQIELAFKRLKSLLHFDQLPAKQPDLARTWLLAHLIAALIIDDHTAEVLDIPPSELRLAA